MMSMTAILIFIYFTCIWFIIVLLAKVKETKYVNVSFVILNCAFFLALNMYYFRVRDNFKFMTFDNTPKLITKYVKIVDLNKLRNVILTCPLATK